MAEVVKLLRHRAGPFATFRLNRWYSLSRGTTEKVLLTELRTI